MRHGALHAELDPGRPDGVLDDWRGLPVTGAVQLVPLTVGWMTMNRSFFLDGAPGRTTAPVTAYLLVHPTRGMAVFDTGLGPRFARPDGASVMPTVDLRLEDLVDARIAAAGHDPALVSIIVNSHLHTDHAGGNASLPGARVIVQQVEWEHALASDERPYHRLDFETGQEVELVSGQHDVFGDSSVVVHPTPGHTPGHQSAVVRTPHGTAVLAGDACNLLANVDRMQLPDHVHDANAYRSSLQGFAELRAGGAQLFPSHDEEFWAGIEDGVPWAGVQGA